MKRLALALLVSALMGCTRVYTIRVQRAIQSFCNVEKDDCIVVISQCSINASKRCRVTAWGHTVEEALTIEAGYWSHEHKRQMELFLRKQGGMLPTERTKWMRHWAEVMRR